MILTGRLTSWAVTPKETELGGLNIAECKGLALAEASHGGRGQVDFAKIIDTKKGARRLTSYLVAIVAM